MPVHCHKEMGIFFIKISFILTSVDKQGMLLN